MTTSPDFGALSRDALSRFPALPSCLKEKQLEIASSILSGRDTFGVLPTGYGKSLIYQILPGMKDAIMHRSPGAFIAIVVSPLTQLIQSQVAFLNDIGIKSVALTTSTTSQDLNDVSLAYGSPEAVLNSDFRKVLRCQDIQRKIAAVVIDEVHCITEWYAAIKHLQETMRDVSLGVSIKRKNGRSVQELVRSPG